MIKTQTVKTVNFGPLLSALDLSEVLNDAALIVKKDIQDRYDKDINLDGSRTAPLAESTIARKLKSKNAKTRDNAHKPLVATENMWRNQKIKKATKTNQVVEISIGPTRDEIYSYHHSGGPNLPARPKFGIADEVGKKIDELAILRIERGLAKL